MKTRSIAFLAASLLTLSVSQIGFAQEDTEPNPDEAEAAASADSPGQGDAETEGEESAPDEGDEAPDDATQSEAAESDAPEESAPEGASATGEDDQSESAQSKSAQSESAQSESAQSKSDSKTGPGGKPLRDDYPGTEESKKSRMDTDRIEGLAFEEGETSDEVYDVRIRELETKVDDLKEKVFRSKSRIVLLKETVLTGNLAGSRAIVSHENDLGGAYVLKRAHYSLDGSRVFNKSDEDLDDTDKFELYNGSVTPGKHRVSILLELQGTGYGMFSYMEGYKFTIKDSCEFSAQEGRGAVLKVRLIDRGGAFSSYEERPGIECVVSSVKLSGDGLEADKEGGDSKPASGGQEAAER
jgi:hypothetical protein